MKRSYVYIISNKNRTTLYIGVTTNLRKRIVSHKNLQGSIFAKKYQCVDLLYYEVFSDVKQAIAREKQLKAWKSDWKWTLIKDFNPDLRDLAED